MFQLCLMDFLSKNRIILIFVDEKYRYSIKIQLEVKVLCWDLIVNHFYGSFKLQYHCYGHAIY